MNNVIRIGHRTIRSFLTGVLLGKEDNNSVLAMIPRVICLIIDCEKALDAAKNKTEGSENLVRIALRDIKKAI